MAERPATPAGIDQYSLVSSATEDELSVSRILLNLSFTMDIVASIPEPKWGSKQKRSCPAAALLPHSSRSIKRRKTQVKATKKESTPPAAPTETASPVTPLAFPPSESDEKSKARYSSKKPSKRKPKDLMAMVEDLTRTGNSLRKGIQNAAKCYSQLQTENSKLKAILLEVRNSCTMKEPVPVKERIAGVNLGAETIALHHQIGVGAAPHPQPLVEDRTAEKIQPLSGPIVAAQMELTNGSGPKSNGLNLDLNVIPDLNVSADDAVSAQPLDEADRAAQSAEARRKRKQAMKNKVCVGTAATAEASQPLDLSEDPAVRRARSAQARSIRKEIISTKARKAAVPKI